MPRLPPETPSVEFDPGLIVEGTAVAEVATADIVLTVTVILTQVVVFKVPSARTKYIVVTVGLIMGIYPEIK